MLLIMIYFENEIIAYLVHRNSIKYLDTSFSCDKYQTQHRFSLCIKHSMEKLTCFAVNVD